MNEIKIGNRAVGPQHTPLVIAEIGINHGGSLDVAIEMADAAIGAGAEVIKHQTHVVQDEMSKEALTIVPGNSDKTIYDIMQTCSLDESQERTLMNHIVSRKCIFISTPFSRAAADRLFEFDVPAIKIGSGECNNYPLVEHIAKFGKPMIVSTGMNTIHSIRPTVEILRRYKIPYALLHCTNVYPTPPSLVRLGAIDQLRQAFPDAVLGLSDHTTTNHACFGAIALGASIVERHFTDSMIRNGPDIECSMDPDALSDLIHGSINISLASGGEKKPVDAEKPTIAFAFSSVVSTRKIRAGERLTEENIWVRRPNGGDFSASDFLKILGKKVCTDLPKNTQLMRKHLEQPHDDVN